MSEEAHAKAAECWPLMFAHAMPARIGLGFVEEVTDGNVPPALMALLTAGVAALSNMRPDADRAEGGSWLDLEAGQIAGLILIGQYDAADTAVGVFSRRLANATDITDGEAWCEWIDNAKRTISLSRVLTAAATAVEVTRA